MLSLVASMQVHAIFNPCAFGALPVVPAHPSDAEVVRLRLGWTLQLGNAGEQVFERVSVVGHALVLELAFADSAAPIAGFRHIGSTHGKSYPNADADSFSSPVGPLAPGTYDVAIKIYRSEPGSGLTQGCLAGGPAFTVTTQSDPTTMAEVIEFYHPQLDHYFITQDQAEISDLDRGVHPGWVRTGLSFLAYTPDNSDSRGSATCRWYASSADVDRHFFSASWNECRAVNGSSAQTWQNETANAFEISLPDLLTGACLAGTQPVYRLWNGRADSNHRYTTSLEIRQQMLERGFVSEGYGDLGVVMCAPQ